MIQLCQQGLDRTGDPGMIVENAGSGIHLALDRDAHLETVAVQLAALVAFRKSG